MKPICPLGLGLMFFARFVSKNVINVIIFGQLKEPAVGGNIIKIFHYATVRVTNEM